MSSRVGCASAARFGIEHGLAHKCEHIKQYATITPLKTLWDIDMENDGGLIDNEQFRGINAVMNRGLESKIKDITFYWEQYW